MSEVEIVARRRKWTAQEKAALLAEVEAEGGRVSVVARRHGISNSLLYNWRSAWRAAASLRTVEPVAFMPLGMIGRAGCGEPAFAAALDQPASRDRRSGDGRGVIEIALPSGACIRVDGKVNEKALRCVLQAVKGAV
jgi:transposase